MPQASLVEIHHPDDPALAALYDLLVQVFADPNLLFPPERVREFVARARAADRRFHILTARADGRVVGGTVFSYLPESGCGFSEYIVLEAGARGRGLGRALFERRRQILDADAGEFGQPGCRGLFIETESPTRTPPEILALEQAVSLDPWERWRMFRRLGYRRCDAPYIHVPLGPGQEPVDYLDLLFAPWAPADPAAIPSAWIQDTLAPMWRRWAPDRCDEAMARFGRLVGVRDVALHPLPDGRS